MQPLRSTIIKQADFNGKSVVYVMSRDQRVSDNHALIAAQELAHKHGVPLYVLFVLRAVPHRSREHYTFMLDGLAEISTTLAAYDIQLVIRAGTPRTLIPEFASEIECGALFFDFNPLASARHLVRDVSETFHGSVTVVDTHNIIPAWSISDKKEFAAHTMRTKIHRQLQNYLLSPPPLQAHTTAAPQVASLSIQEARHYIQTIPESGITIEYKAGEAAAHQRLKEFITDDLINYAVARNDIANDQQSGLSPYLHFGHISSLRVALEVIDSVNQPPLLLAQAKLAEHGDTPSSVDGMNALLEEMIVRKELADNFCLYSPSHSTLDAAPAWALASLTEHHNDVRDFTYTQEQWETATTHDTAWNAAQLELRTTGKIHGYMRMYWAKKLLEWSATAEEALRIGIYLNDKYSIDGGDPNGYVGLLWSIAGLHDRPWFDRAVYGKIRYMNESGLRRKFDVDAYIQRVGTIKQ